MKDLCAICGKPFPVDTTRFLHFIGHIQKGEAVGRFNDKGNWRFEKVGKPSLSKSVQG
jgi:hypothetical protein